MRFKPLLQLSGVFDLFDFEENLMLTIVLAIAPDASISCCIMSVGV